MYGLISVQRFYQLPIVKTGVDKATDIYVKVKTSNRLVKWSLQTAEATVTIAIDLSKPTIVLFDGPIHLIDEILCKSLDMMEEAVPIIKQEPDQIYEEAMNYVSAVISPVLKRADSVKEISIQSALTYSNKAAESLDSVLNAADEIVEKYLPEIHLDGEYSVTDSSSLEEVLRGRLKNLRDYAVSAVERPPRNATEKTIRHVEKLSRTLRRRLTQRTIYEARALKKQGVNTIQILVHLTDLLARDPKAFVQKMKDVWQYLSQEEPENQEPPQNLEELLVMLTREGARRFVHVANFMRNNIVKVPEQANAFIHWAMVKYSEYVQNLNLTSTGIKRQADILIHAMNDIFDTFMDLLKPFLSITSGGEERRSFSNSRNVVKAIAKGFEHKNNSTENNSNEEVQTNGGTVLSD